MRDRKDHYRKEVIELVVIIVIVLIAVIALLFWQGREDRVILGSPPPPPSPAVEQTAATLQDARTERAKYEGEQKVLDSKSQAEEKAWQETWRKIEAGEIPAPYPPGD